MLTVAARRNDLAGSFFLSLDDTAAAAEIKVGAAAQEVIPTHPPDP